MSRSSAISSLGTVWRTARHLKLSQVLGRLRRKLPFPAADQRPAPPRRARSADWVHPARREPALIAPAQLRFLNVVHDLDRCGWDSPEVGRLWRYNLHYFDDLNARDGEARRPMQRALVARWLRENPPGPGTAWEPYPVSLRVTNWVKWFLGGEPPEPAWLDSLATQVRWLQARLEYHLLGNHLFSNAKALVFAGAFFAGSEADRWLREGAEILLRELPEQILSDGGQFERSPMYHAIALEDVLDLLNVLSVQGGGDPVLQELRRSLQQIASAMLYWLRCMLHGDGGMGQFNDSAESVAPSAHELEQYAQRLAIHARARPLDAVVHLDASGYVSACRGSAVLLLDLAPLGPDFLPAHGHADTLSFELSLGRRRVIVNGGTSCYGISPQRLHERSTAAHSTVEVDGMSSSEVWSDFRVGRRARVRDISINGWRVCAAHDGYRHLKGRPIHHRCWTLGAGDLAVDDRVTPGSLPATARYLIAPGIRLQQTASDSWEMRDDATRIASVQVVTGRGILTETSHAHEFGRVTQIPCLEVALIDGRASTRWTWLDHEH